MNVRIEWAADKKKSTLVWKNARIKEQKVEANEGKD